MWVATQSGFYSVVEHRDHKGFVLLVRCRVKADADRLAAYCGSPVIHTPEADYPWRLEVTRFEWEAFLANEVEHINYDNFKARIGATDRTRARIYEDVWYELQRLHWIDDKPR